MIPDILHRALLLGFFLTTQTFGDAVPWRDRQNVLDEPELEIFAFQNVAPMAAAPPQKGKPGDRSKWTLECSSVDPQSNCTNINKVSDRLFWRSASIGFPQNLTVNLGEEVAISGIRMTPSSRNSDPILSLQGNIARHEVYVSIDKVNWMPVAYGTWWGDNTGKCTTLSIAAS